MFESSRVGAKQKTAYKITKIILNVPWMAIYLYVLITKSIIFMSLIFVPYGIKETRENDKNCPKFTKFQSPKATERRME